MFHSDKIAALAASCFARNWCAVQTADNINIKLSIEAIIIARFFSLILPPVHTRNLSM